MANIDGNQGIDQEMLDYFATLPKAKGFLSDMYRYQGFWVYGLKLQGIITAQKQHYELDPTSGVLLASYPKSGTTWLKALLFAITTRTQYQNLSAHPLLTSNPHNLVPEIEHYAVMNPLNPVQKNISVLSSHIPFNSLPESIKCSGCPIVYVYRNPKDVIISFWQFSNTIRSKNSAPPLPMEEALDMFCTGMTPYGPYWDHLLGYWEASLKMPERILFIGYEELKAKPVECVKKLARFVGHEFSVEEENNGTPESIIELCSFQNLSNLKVSKSDAFELPSRKISNSIFFRKGQVGDHMNYLSTEMIERIDEIMKQKLKDIGLVLCFLLAF